MFVLNCNEYDPNRWPLRGHESASSSCGAVSATPIAAGVFGYARGKNSCVSTTPRGSSHRRSIGNRADCARRGGSLPLKTCSLPNGRAVLRGWSSDCRWSTRSFCRGRSRGLAAAAGEGFPRACGKRRRRAAAPRNVPHLPARDELGGAMTARARQPTPALLLKWPARRVPLRLSAMTTPGANVVRRCSQEGADGLFFVQRRFASQYRSSN